MNKLIIPIIATVAVGIGAFFVLQKPGLPEPSSIKEPFSTSQESQKENSKDSAFGISGGRVINFNVDRSVILNRMGKYNLIFSDLGVKLSRDDSETYIFAWQNVEPEKGSMDFSKLDSYVYSSDIVSSLAVVIPFVDWDQKSCVQNTEQKCAYRQCSQDCLDNGNSEEKCCEEAKWKCMPCDIKAYQNFLGAMVNRYKDKIKYWEILQEPDLGPPPSWKGDWTPPFWRSSEEDYVELLKESYETIHKVCDDCIVTSAGFAGLDNNFITKIMDLGAQNYFDVFSFHHYGDHTNLEYLLKNTSYKIKKDMWITETGSINYAKALFQGQITEEIYNKRQAEYLVKNYVTAFGLSVKKVFWHKLWYDGKDTTGWSYVALTDISNKNKKPAYYTYKLMKEKLDYFDSVETIKKGQYKFTFNDKKSVYVLWNDAGNATADLSNYTNAENVLITYIIIKDGQIQPETKTIKANNISISDTPIFAEEK